jgi:hypothetical protein
MAGPRECLAKANAHSVSDAFTVGPVGLGAMADVLKPDFPWHGDDPEVRLAV